MRPVRHILPTLAAVLLAATLANAQTALPPADEVLAQAKAQAAAEHKNILLTFSASWCGPCHMFEHFLDDSKIKPIIDKSFVIARLDVDEHDGDTHHADSPGAKALRASLGGGTAGDPYIVMLDPSGKPIVNSFRPTSKPGPGDNIGYPDLPVEIDWFMHMLTKAAPALSPQDAKTVNNWLTAHAT